MPCVCSNTGFSNLYFVYKFRYVNCPRVGYRKSVTASNSPRNTVYSHSTSAAVVAPKRAIPTTLPKPIPLGMGPMFWEAEEYPGRPRADARRSLDGEPCNVEHDERAAAATAAAAASAAQHYYYASQQQQHPQAPPSAFEWQELNLGSIHMGEALAARQYQVPKGFFVAAIRGCGTLPRVEPTARIVRGRI